MRTGLAIVFAFALGVLLTLLWHRPSTADITPAPIASTPATADSSQDLPDDAADDGDSWPPQAPTPEQVIYAQPALLHTALAKLGPRVPGRPNLYVVVFAADGSEDVFHNEAAFAARLFTQRFGSTAHALVLENHPDTLATQPLASWSNLDAALDGVARMMHPDEDILLLYVTTHGDEDHNLLVDMDPLPLDQIGAPDLAEILHDHPFKWKVVVVNACYSGGFVPDLKGPGTLVLTAARSDRSSFGCGSESKLTYFGHAWLVDALNRTTDFVAAFKQARGQISRWEQQDRLTPSDPQIDIGRGIAAQLALWRKGITPGPAIPFKPAVPTRTRAAASAH